MGEEFAEAFKVLSKRLSYVLPGSGFMMKKRTGIWKNLYVHLITKLGQFPTGLIRFAIDELMKNNFDIELQDLRIPPELNQHNYRLFRSLPELRQYQKDAAAAATPQQPRGVFELSTGTGKTYIILEITRRLGLNTLILVPNLSILNQFYKRLEYHFGKKYVGKIGGGSKNFDKPIIIGTYQSVIKCLDVIKDKIDLLIVDEAHRCSCDTIKTINNSLTRVYYRYYFTATPFRNDGSDMELIGVIGSNKLFFYPHQRALREGFLTPPIFVIFDFKHPDVERGPDFGWREEQEKLIIENQSYNAFIARITCDIHKEPNKNILIFVERIEHGNALNKLIPGSVFINGQKDNKYVQKQIELFGKGKIPTLISTKIVGEGTDLVEVDTCILASAGEAKSDIIQKIGRILRPSQLKDKKYSTFIDFTHQNSRFLKSHFKERLKIYEKYETKVIYK